MVSLIVLAMVLSAPANVAVVASDPLAVSPPPIVLTHPDTPLFAEPQLDTFDRIEIQPTSDICYKIRAYVFSTDALPKLVRETTCGPKRARTRSVEGSEPKLIPLDAKQKPSPVPDR